MQYLVSFIIGYFSVIIEIVILFYPKKVADFVKSLDLKTDKKENLDEILLNEVLISNQFNAVYIFILSVILIFLMKYSTILALIIAFNIVCIMRGMEYVQVIILHN